MNDFKNQSELLENIASLHQTYKKESNTGISPREILLALEQFTECVRYLNTRRSEGAKLNLESEADVQDAIYLMLRPWVHDLVYESPTAKSGNRFVIKDFLSKSSQTIIEAKFIRDETHGKQISREIHDDIEMYRRHPDCNHLIFFIYDKDSLIPDVAALNEEIKTNRVYDGRSLYCYLIVKP